MTIVRVKGFKIYRDCRQKMRCYHRKTGEPVDLGKSADRLGRIFCGMRENCCSCRGEGREKKSLARSAC